jgi:RNA polymerase sigma factor (TIGR02999 family)
MCETKLSDMATDNRIELTRSLLAIQADEVTDPAAAKRVFELVYDELRRLASGLMRGERVDHTLQSTALVHEAYVRLVDDTLVEWENRAHFFRIAAQAMRRILVDHARRRAAAKRGGGWDRITLDERLGVAAPPDIEILQLEEALTQLGEMDARMARVVELRVFAGMTVEEVAHVLQVSERTVHKDWRVAKIWLARELAGGEPP